MKRNFNKLLAIVVIASLAITGKVMAQAEIQSMGSNPKVVFGKNPGSSQATCTGNGICKLSTGKEGAVTSWNQFPQSSPEVVAFTFILSEAKKNGFAVPSGKPGEDAWYSFDGGYKFTGDDGSGVAAGSTIEDGAQGAYDYDEATDIAGLSFTITAPNSAKAKKGKAAPPNKTSLNAKVKKAVKTGKPKKGGKK